MGPGRDAMQDVELVDVDLAAPAGDDGREAPGGGARDGSPRGGSPAGASPEDGAPDAAAWRRWGRRRRARRWAPAAVLVVAGLLGTQALLDARERDRLAAVQAVPGVVRHVVGPDLAPDGSPPTDDPWTMLGGIAAGRLRIGPDGRDQGDDPRAVHALDVTTGEQVWRTVLDAGTGTREGAETPACAAGDPPVAVVVCHVTDRASQPGTSDGWALGPATAARAVTLDAATGRVRAVRELAPVSAATVTGDLLVVAELEDGAVLLRGEDLGDGTERWTARVPHADPGGSTYAAPSLEVAGGHVLLWTPAGTTAVDPADGRVEATAGELLVSRGDRLLGRGVAASSGGGALRLLGADGSGTATTPGDHVQLDVDDGSVPDLELVTLQDGADRVLRAVDAASGDVVWERHVDWLETTWILLDGVLYGGERETVWAADAATGADRWSTPTTGPPDWRSLLTDGRSLLLVEMGEGGARVTAFALGSGSPRWTTDLPRELGTLFEWEGELYGTGESAVVRLR